MSNAFRQVDKKPAKELVGFAKMAQEDPIHHRHLTSHGGRVAHARGTAFELDSEAAKIARAIREARRNNDRLEVARLRYEMQLYVHGLTAYITIRENPEAQIVAKAKTKKKPAAKPATKPSVPAKKGAGTPKKTGKKK